MVSSAPCWIARSVRAGYHAIHVRRAVRPSPYLVEGRHVGRRQHSVGHTTTTNYHRRRRRKPVCQLLNLTLQGMHGLTYVVNLSGMIADHGLNCHRQQVVVRIR